MHFGPEQKQQLEQPLSHQSTQRPTHLTHILQHCAVPAYTEHHTWAVGPWKGLSSSPCLLAWWVLRFCSWGPCCCLPLQPQPHTAGTASATHTDIPTRVCDGREDEQDFWLLTWSVFSLQLCKENRWASKPTLPEYQLWECMHSFYLKCESNGPVLKIWAIHIIVTLF